MRLCLLLFFLLMLSACSETIDSSTDESFNLSVRRVLLEMPDALRAPSLRALDLACRGRCDSKTQMRLNGKEKRQFIRELSSLTSENMQLLLRQFDAEQEAFFAVKRKTDLISDATKQVAVRYLHTKKSQSAFSGHSFVSTLTAKNESHFGIKLNEITCIHESSGVELARHSFDTAFIDDAATIVVPQSAADVLVEELTPPHLVENLPCSLTRAEIFFGGEWIPAIEPSSDFRGTGPWLEAHERNQQLSSLNAQIVDHQAVLLDLRPFL